MPLYPFDQCKIISAVSDETEIRSIMKLCEKIKIIIVNVSGRNRGLAMCKFV